MLNIRNRRAFRTFNSEYSVRYKPLHVELACVEVHEKNILITTSLGGAKPHPNEHHREKQKERIPFHIKYLCPSDYLLELQSPVDYKSAGSRFPVKPFRVTLHFRVELPC